MRVFLTGGSGFLGSAIARELTRKGHDVVASVRPGAERAHLDALGIQVLEGQLHDASFLHLAMRDCEGLAHIAGAAGRYYPDPNHYERVNVDLTRTVFQVAREAGVSRAVYCGTVVIPQGLSSPYAVSKGRGVAVAREVAGEQMVVTVVHPSGMVGPEDRAPTPLGRGLLALAADRTRFSVGGGGGFVHVDDSAEMHVAALESGADGAEYIANAEYRTIQELFAILAPKFNVQPPRWYLPFGVMWLLANTLEPLARLVGRVPPITRFTVTYLAQEPSTNPSGIDDRARLGLGPYRCIESGCLECVEWHRQRENPS